MTKIFKTIQERFQKSETGLLKTDFFFHFLNGNASKSRSLELLPRTLRTQLNLKKKIEQTNLTKRHETSRLYQTFTWK